MQPYVYVLKEVFADRHPKTYLVQKNIYKRFLFYLLLSLLNFKHGIDIFSSTSWQLEKL